MRKGLLTCLLVGVRAVTVVVPDMTVNAAAKYDLNAAVADFTQEMQKSHVAENLFVSVIEFDETVRVKNGFQPILNLQTINFAIAPSSSGTALYDAVKLGMENALSWRDSLQIPV